MPPDLRHPNITNSNNTKHVVSYNPAVNGSAVVIIPTLSTDAREVERESLRDPGFTSTYWTFIVVYSIASTSIFLLAFLILNLFRKFSIKKV
jgi:hypothetical protein